MIWRDGLVAVAVLMASTAFAADPIKIGLSAAFTGGSATSGISIRDAVRLAADEINQSGGLLGRPILLVERDDEGKNEIGVQVAQELINKEHVVATVGFANTGVALAASKFYQEAEIPVIVNVASGSLITKQFLPPEYKNNYIFRTGLNDETQTIIIANEIVKRRGFKKPAILADTTNFGQLGKADLIVALAKLNVTPVVSEKYNIGDTDMTSQLLRAKEAGADVIVPYGIGPELGQIANGLAKLGWKVPIIGPATLSYGAFIDTAGKNGDGATMPVSFIQYPSTPKRKAFIDSYQRTFKVDRMPSAHSASQGYDSMYVLAAAITQAGSTDGRKIREALEDLRQKVEGVVTIYDRPFSATDHEAINSDIPVFAMIKDGRVVPAHPEDLEGADAVRIKHTN